MKIVKVQFNGFIYEVALELRSEPGVFTELAWLPDEEHNLYNDYLMSDEARGKWNAFHKATDDAFGELGAKSVWIKSEKITYIREARTRAKAETQPEEEAETQTRNNKKQKSGYEINGTGQIGSWEFRQGHGATPSGFMIPEYNLDAPEILPAGSMIDPDKQGLIRLKITVRGL